MFYLMYTPNAMNIINLVVWIIEGLLYLCRHTSSMVHESTANVNSYNTIII